MKNETIRFLDVWGGSFVCLLLTGLRRVRDLLGGSGDGSRQVEKILFLKLVEQGATVSAYGAIERAVEMVGRENVYFCVFEENRPILDILDIVPPENVFPVRHDSLFVFLRETLTMLRRVRELGIDATVDMEFFARAPAILAFLTGAKRRVGLHRFTSEGPYRGDLMTHRIQYNPYMNVAVAYRLLVEGLARDPKETPLLKTPWEDVPVAAPEFRPNADEVEQARQCIQEALGSSTGRPLILLNPNASDMLPLRKWPSERFVGLGRRLLAECPAARILITGAPSEREAAEATAGVFDSPRVASLAGKTTLRELMAIYTLADLLITNDSGPGHFASMTGIDSIVLFGPETPEVFCPLGERTHVIWKDLACSPCVNVFNHRFSPCRDNVCMQSITIDEVLSEARRLLDERAKRLV